jgi:hypothetical protein
MAPRHARAASTASPYRRSRDDLVALAVAGLIELSRRRDNVGLAAHAEVAAPEPEAEAELAATAP